MAPRETRMPFHAPPSAEAWPQLQHFRPRIRDAVDGVSHAFAAQHVADLNTLTANGRESMAPGDFMHLPPEFAAEAPQVVPPQHDKVVAPLPQGRPRPPISGRPAAQKFPPSSEIPRGAAKRVDGLRHARLSPPRWRT